MNFFYHQELNPGLDTGTKQTHQTPGASRECEEKDLVLGDSLDVSCLEGFDQWTARSAQETRHAGAGRPVNPALGSQA